MVIVFSFYGDVQQFYIICATALAELQPYYRAACLSAIGRWDDDFGNDVARLFRAYRSQYSRAIKDSIGNVCVNEWRICLSSNYAAYHDGLLYHLADDSADLMDTLLCSILYELYSDVIDTAP